MKLYSSHVPTTFVQKAIVGLSSSIFGFIDPRRAQDVAALGEVTGAYSLRFMREKMLESESGRKILLEKPSLKDTVNLDG